MKKGGAEILGAILLGLTIGIVIWSLSDDENTKSAAKLKKSRNRLNQNPDQQNLISDWNNVIGDVKSAKQKLELEHEL